MYTPVSFRVEERETIREFVAANSFGILLSQSPEGIEDTHTPMVFSEDSRWLYGHIARANHQWRHWETAPRVRVIFHGPHAYISPSYYVSPFNVPTWNYTAVSIQGTIELIDDPETKLAILQTLVDKYELPFQQPWELDTSDERYLKLLDAIVGFRVAVETVEAKFKLNQNKQPEDRLSVIRHLRETGHPGDAGVAALMEAGGL